MTTKKKAELSPVAETAQALVKRMDELVGDGHPMKFYYHLPAALGELNLGERSDLRLDELLKAIGFPGEYGIDPGIPARLVTMLQPLTAYRISEINTALFNYNAIAESIMNLSNFDSIYVMLDSMGLTPEFMSRARALYNYLFSTSLWMPNDKMARMLAVGEFHEYCHSLGFGTVQGIGALRHLNVSDEICAWLHHRLLTSGASIDTAVTKLSANRWGPEEFDYYSDLSRHLALHLDRSNAEPGGAYKYIERGVAWYVHTEATNMCRDFKRLVERKLSAADGREEPMSAFNVVITREGQRIAMETAETLMALEEKVATEFPIRNVIRQVLENIESTYRLAPMVPPDEGRLSTGRVETWEDVPPHLRNGRS